MTTVFGIKNCDTIKKARKWLEQNSVEFQFHDFRADGLDLQWLEQAEAALGWEALLNKRGTTFRQLSDDQKADLDRAKALALLEQHPAMIKRPVLAHEGNFYLGFSDKQYTEIFK